MSGAAPRIKGIVLCLGGVDHVVPPLTLGALEDHDEQIAAIDTLSSSAQLRLIVDLAHRALVRNYPDLDRRAVAEMLDLTNAHQVYAAVMGNSIPAPEPATPGEPGAVAGGTGWPSTPTSPPVSAGPSSTAGTTSPSTS